MSGMCIIDGIDTHWRCQVRTNVVINDEANQVRPQGLRDQDKEGGHRRGLKATYTNEKPGKDKRV